MTDSNVAWFRYVPLSRVQSYLDLGWIPDGAGPLPKPHGLYATILQWPHPSDPVEPPKPIHNDSIPAKSEAAQ